jgi:ATP-dependent Lon protease
LRGGITTVLIPQENVKDLEEIPANVKRDLKLIPVSTVDEVLKLALTRPLVASDWRDPEPKDAVPPASADDAETDGSGVVTH